MRALRPHLRFANIVAVLALFVALGSGAYAALGKNSVKSKQIKNGAVKTQDLRSKAVTSDKLAAGLLDIADGSITTAKLADGAATTAKLADDSVTGAKVAADSLSGADVDESQLSGVDAATLDGLAAKKVNYQVSLGAATPTVLSMGGLQIDVGCIGGSEFLDINASTSKSNARVAVTAMDTANTADDTDGLREIGSDADYDFDIGETFHVDNALPNLGGFSAFTLHYSAPDGTAVVAELFGQEVSQMGVAAGCKLTGIAIGG
jgi:hypothetical protein